MERVRLLTRRELGYLKISIALTGKPRPDVSAANSARKGISNPKASAALSGLVRPEISARQLGVPRPNEVKVKISKTLTGRSRPDISAAMIEKNGTGSVLHPRQSKEYFLFIEEVLRRDNYTCQHCGMSNEESLLKYRRRLDVHHIQSFDQFPELRFVVSNGLTLCLSCHRKEDARLQGKGKAA